MRNSEGAGIEPTLRLDFNESRFNLTITPTTHITMTMWQVLQAYQANKMQI